MNSALGYAMSSGTFLLIFGAGFAGFRTISCGSAGQYFTARNAAPSTTSIEAASDSGTRNWNFSGTRS